MHCWIQGEGCYDEPPSRSNFYRTQTKFAKVMFLHLSVCPRVGVSRPRPRGEVGGSGLGDLGPDPGGMFGGLARGVSRPTHGGGCVQPQAWEAPGRGGVSQHALRQTPLQQMATAVGGMHPTGMHSLFMQFSAKNGQVIGRSSTFGAQSRKFWIRHKDGNTNALDCIPNTDHET